jgi:integrase/recombinase XerD
MNTSAALLPILQTHNLPVPSLIAREDERTAKRFLEFFTATIRNPNTREAYARAVSQFLAWCESYGLTLKTIEPMIVAAYIEQHKSSIPTIKQHLSALNMLFDWLVTGQIIPFNPAASVKSPRYSIKKGKTPVLLPEEARELLESISTENLIGLRDKALIAVMVYSFARVSAIVQMQVKDYYASGKRYWLRLHEKGGKFHEVPVHHKAEEYLDMYMETAGLEDKSNTPLFRTIYRTTGLLTENAMSRVDAYKMIRRRARAAGIKAVIGCHTFRATGITAYLSNGGKLEHAQNIAAHESPRTTKLYDRTSDIISLDEIEKIII